MHSAIVSEVLLKENKGSGAVNSAVGFYFGVQGQRAFVEAQHAAPLRESHP